MPAAQTDMKTLLARGHFAVCEPALAGAEVGDEFDIQWMPPGRQDPECYCGDPPKPRRLSFDVTPALAAKFNAQLQQLRSRAAAGQCDVPYFDFNHEDDRRSGEPTELYWAGDDARKGGIRARGKWTGSGKTALQNRDFRRFSPMWDFDVETEEPIGIGENLGGLVTRAAFRRIQPVVAKDAGKREEGENEMETKEFKELLDAGLKPLSDRLGVIEARGTATAAAAAADRGQDARATLETTVAAAVTTALKPITEKLATLETATRLETARAKLAPHIRRGAIAPDDQDSIGVWTDAVLKDPEKAEKAMAKLPGRRLGQITGAAGSAALEIGAAGPDAEIRTKATAMAKGAPDRFKRPEDALASYLTGREGDAAYRAYRDQVLNGVGLPTKRVEVN
jgi:hypothetical protein